MFSGTQPWRGRLAVCDSAAPGEGTGFVASNGGPPLVSVLRRFRLGGGPPDFWKVPGPHVMSGRDALPGGCDR
jgi:hypothetical protein